MKIDKNKIDVSQCWLVYMSLVGDVERTAAAMDLSPAVIEKLAKDEGWDEKIRRVSLLSKSGKPGDWERAQNRALCFVQAQRLRATIDTVIGKIFNMDANELVDFMSTAKLAVGTPKEPRLRVSISSRFLADLASAMEKVHHLSYTALGDTVTERASRATGPDGEVSGNDLHAAVVAALNNPNATFVPSKELEAETLRQIRDSAGPSPLMDEPKDDSQGEE